MLDRSIPVSEIMSTELITVKPKEPMTVVDKIFKQHEIHHIPVVNEEKTLVGIISKEDYLRTLHGLTLFKVSRAETYNEAMLRSLLAEEVMTKKIAHIHPDKPISLAADILMENLFHALPVIDNGQLLGLITSYDLLKYAYRVSK